MENKTIGMLLEEVKIELITYINETCEKKGLSLYLIEIPFSQVYRELLQQKEIEVKNEQNKWLEEHPINLENVEIKENEESDK